MNKTLIGFLILLGLIASAALGIYLMLPRQDKLGELLTAAMREPEKMPELLAYLDREINRSPEDFSLRSTRASVYAESGRTAEALNDIEALITRNPDNLGLAFVRCTLKEKLGGGPRAGHLACYRDVAARFDDTPEAPKHKNPDYIVAALMGELPEADDLRRGYLAGLGNSDPDKHLREILTHFKPENLTGVRP
jgi:hypothetical protein